MPHNTEMIFPEEIISMTNIRESYAETRNTGLLRVVLMYDNSDQPALIITVLSALLGTNKICGKIARATELRHILT